MPSLTIDTTVDIDASRDAVWDVLTDFASYSEWNPSMRIEGTAEVGTKLVVHLLADGGHGMSCKPKVLAATPGEELRWLGKLGFHGIADESISSSSLPTITEPLALTTANASPAHWSRLQKAAQETVALPMKHSVRPSNNASSISAELENAPSVEGQGCRDASPA